LTGSPKEVGAVFRQRLLDIPNLKNEQRLGVLKTIDTSTISDLGPIKEVIARDHYFNIFSSGIKNSEEEQKCIYEITRLSKIYSETSIKELLDFLSAFDPIYEKGVNRFVSSEVTIIEESANELDFEKVIKDNPQIKWIKNEYKALKRDFNNGLDTYKEDLSDIKPDINFNVKEYLKEWGIKVSNNSQRIKREGIAETFKKIFAIAIIFWMSCTAIPKMFIDIFIREGNSPIPVGSLEEMITDFISLSLILLILNFALKSLDKSKLEKPFWHVSIPRKTIQQIPLVVGILFGFFRANQYYDMQIIWEGIQIIFVSAVIYFIVFLNRN
tara:strand:- start:222 stop:1202 length:981 start_codon:yes stop_codon:yes gene_type:complete